MKSLIVALALILSSPAFAGGAGDVGTSVESGSGAGHNDAFAPCGEQGCAGTKDGHELGPVDHSGQRSHTGGISGPVDSKRNMAASGSSAGAPSEDVSDNGFLASGMNGQELGPAVEHDRSGHELGPADHSGQRIAADGVEDSADNDWLAHKDGHELGPQSGSGAGRLVAGVKDGPAAPVEEGQMRIAHTGGFGAPTESGSGAGRGEGAGTTAPVNGESSDRISGGGAGDMDDGSNRTITLASGMNGQELGPVEQGHIGRIAGHGRENPAGPVESGSGAGRAEVGGGAPEDSVLASGMNGQELGPQSGSGAGRGDGGPAAPVEEGQMRIAHTGGLCGPSECNDSGDGSNDVVASVKDGHELGPQSGSSAGRVITLASGAGDDVHGAPSEEVFTDRVSNVRLAIMVGCRVGDCITEHGGGPAAPVEEGKGSKVVHRSNSPAAPTEVFTDRVMEAETTMSAVTGGSSAPCDSWDVCRGHELGPVESGSGAGRLVAGVKDGPAAPVEEGQMRVAHTGQFGAPTESGSEAGRSEGAGTTSPQDSVLASGMNGQELGPQSGSSADRVITLAGEVNGPIFDQMSDR